MRGVYARIPPTQQQSLSPPVSPTLVQVNGWATTINYGRVLAPAIHAARLLSPQPGKTAILVDTNGLCTPCATWAMFRPRPVLLRALASTPLVTSTPLVCIKERHPYTTRTRSIMHTLVAMIVPNVPWCLSCYRCSIARPSAHAVYPSLCCHGLADGLRCSP